MADFPASPLSPSEFMHEFLPKAFAESEDLRAQLEGLDTRLGVRLDGEGGGEWVVHLKAGGVQVEAASREAAAFTVIQTVEDWRGALWEGRGGVFGKGATAMFKPGEAASAPGGIGAAPSPAALAQMESLSGLMRMVVTGGEGGDWAVAFKLGPGEIPEEPTTTISVSAEDATAMETGELNPMEAFMAGRVQVAGDMTLMMQMQAIQMQVAAGPPGGGSGS